VQQGKSKIIIIKKVRAFPALKMFCGLMMPLFRLKNYLEHHWKAAASILHF
jgi:hypothetical protein